MEYIANPAHRPASFSRRPGEHTIEETAHHFVEDIIAGLDDPDESGGVYASEAFTARSYMVAGNGPSAWFYVVQKAGGGIEEVFFLYSEGDIAAVRVPPQHWDKLVTQLKADHKMMER